jgi:peptidoglycan/xylan/chitin deacetylase (PgdA/CDA1 family)
VQPGDHWAMGQRFRPLVLCYHAVSDGWNHPLSVRRAALEGQVQHLLARRYRPVSAEELVAGGRLFHVTFDDAFRSVRGVLPTLEELGVPVTIFVCPGYADGGQPLTVPELASEMQDHRDELETMDWDSLRELAARGVELGSHTVTHAHLTELSDRELAVELRASRERLESELLRPCRFVAYPYGEHDARVRVAARASGYQLGFALPGRTRPRDPFAVPRVGIWRKDGLLRSRLKTSALRHVVASVRDVT